MKDMLKRKSFVISTILILILIVVGFNIPNIIKAVKGDDQGDKLLVVDRQNKFEGTLENLKQMNLGYDIEIASENFTDEQIKEKID